VCISGVLLLYHLIIYENIKYLRCTPKVNQQQTEVPCALESIHTHVGLGQSVIQLRTNTPHYVDGVSSWHNFASGASEKNH